MSSDWNSGREGYNLKFKRETLLNYAMNRWGLNKASSVGATSELIRQCAPKAYEDWGKFYFENAAQKKKDGIKITRDYIETLGKELYIKLSEVVENELSSISEEECIDYVYNLFINRTFEGYRTEIETIYGQLEKAVGCQIKAAPDEWDRTFGVDFYIQVKDSHIGIQIKPVSSMDSVMNYGWIHQNKDNYNRFSQIHQGKVFFIFSKKNAAGKKQIVNTEVIEDIKTEIKRLSDL